MARSRTIVDSLYHPKVVTAFEPFQAMRLLELIANDQENRLPPVDWIPLEESFRYRTHVTLGSSRTLLAQILVPDSIVAEPFDERQFPEAAAIRHSYVRRHHLERPGAKWRQKPTMVGNFFGLFGQHGGLPILYTRKLLELAEQSTNRSTRTALRDWLDLFNHRMAQLLYRAWEKYRFTIPYVRTSWRRTSSELQPANDRISTALFSLVGIGTQPLRNRLGVFPGEYRRNPATPPLARIDDRVLLRHVGSFARRRAGAHELRAILEEYFGISIRVIDLLGQWLTIPLSEQTELKSDSTAQLGVNVIAGERIWDFNSRFRLVLGPMSYEEFVDFLPDPTPLPSRKAAFLLSQLTRYYVGAEFDFDIQLVLREQDVKEPWLKESDESELGLRLGWNLWLCGENGLGRDADEMIFDAPCQPLL